MTASHPNATPETASTRSSEAGGSAQRSDGQGRGSVRPSYRFYAVIVAIFASLLLVSNIAATQGVVFGPVWGFPINTDGGFLLFPLAYVLGDVLSEVYGFKRTRTATIVSFCIAIGAMLYFQFVIALPKSEGTDTESFNALLGLSVPQILLGSVLGFLVGQTLNAWVVTWMKRRRRDERQLWARLLGSTVVGEFADTLIFCLIAAPVLGFTEPADFAIYVALGFVYKTAVEAALLPFTYRVIAWVKRHEPDYRPVGAGESAAS
ncbi:queuosine precursor transporter [Pseudoclavibacter sp. CFCC 11306]|uniref:queuosine precursor transporter n=1 Tax=Pseudoclavibacter sp. CFCC 11306 TaxID=1564493 RepID=UPI00130197DA|nr:queuosine precursor transporter [Pseudoclavibacter sp. CFCC 11306]KAB1658963.1 queuosine precursor transporter [Pseudoclavibacter sp. CFCC 11306]